MPITDRYGTALKQPEQKPSVQQSLDSWAFTPYKPQFFVGVSEEQLKDPAYLRSFGFPIVVV